MYDSTVTQARAPRRRPGRPSASDAQARREALMRSALEEFLDKGFVGANLDRIARDSGISKMTIYRQYGSKVDLFELVAENAVASLRTDYQAIISAGGPPEKIIRAIVEISRENAHQNAFGILRLFIAECFNFPDLVLNFHQRTVKLTEPVASYLRTLDPAISEETAMMRALMLTNIAVGGFLRLINGTEPLKEEWSEQVCRLFTKGAQADPAPG